jgi:hypothetical protein
LLGLWLLSACSARSCHGCEDDGLAELVERAGQVQRDLAQRPGQFSAAELGASFHSGDAVRTLVSASARLNLRDAGAVLVKSDTTIRLWRGDKSRRLRLKVQTGDASVVSAQRAIEIETELGVAVLQPGSQLRVRPARHGQRYEVTFGRAILSTADGQQVTLGAGEGIGVDTAVEPGSSAAAPAALPPAAPDAGATDAEPQPIETLHGATGELTLGLGASATIYDPKPPTAVALDWRALCPEGATLALGRRTPTRLALGETLLLPTGTHDYKLNCLNAEGAPTAVQSRGSVRVVRNPGTAQLPRSAPKNTIEADGRSYTIMFQNLLPVLEVRWPHAPDASAYELTVQLGTGRALQLHLDKPQHVFAAGALPEGSHTLRFEAQRAGNPRSRETTVELRYDNASPVASLRAPSVAGFEPGASVHVAGIALPGSQVSVFGQSFALDAQQRFAGDVPVPAGTRAIAVRIQHPRTGIRYFVRRLRTAP